MQIKSGIKLAAVMATVAMGLCTSGARADLTFVSLAPVSALTNNTGGTYASSAIDGSIAYSIVSGTASPLPQISAVTGLSTASPSTSSSAFVTTSTWTAGGGASTGMSGQLWSAGNNLEFYDSTTANASIMRIDKTTGGVSKYVDKATILAATTLASGTSQTSATINGTSPTSTGELAISDTKTKAIYVTAGTNVLNVLVSPSALSTTAGHPTSGTVSGFSVVGSQVIVANATDKAVYSYDTTTGTWSTILTTSNITSLTGNPSTSFLPTAFFYAPDNNVYFFDQTARDILLFNPASPASTLQVVVNSAQINSISGATTLTNLAWYNGNIAWDNQNSVGKGLYSAVPEPTSLSLLGLGAGLLVRRSRRKIGQ